MSGSSAVFREQVFGLIDDIRGRYGWRIPTLVALMVVVALTEGIGMVLLLPLLNAIGVSDTTGGGSVGSTVTALLTRLDITGSPYVLTGLLLSVFAVQLALFLVQTWWVSWLQRDYGATWQKLLLDGFLKAKWSFLSGMKLGSMTNQITQETARLSGAFLILAQLAAMVVTVVVYVTVAALISWHVTLILVCFAVAMFVLVRGIRRKNYHIGMRLGPLAAELNVLLTEFLGGIKLIKATATEKQAADRIARVIDELRVQHAWATFLPGLVRAIFEFAAIAGLCFLLVFGYRNLAIPAASMLVILALFVRLLPRFNALQQNMQYLATYLPAFSDARKAANMAAAEAEPERDDRDTGDTSRTVGPLIVQIARGGYQDATILRDIDLTFPTTGVVAIVGESGAGKSTLVNCMLGLAEIADGRVAFGLIDMQSVSLAQWRRQIGYIPQETVLFHQSIRDNIAWVDPAADIEAVEDAAKQALAHEFIVQQPQGYETIIGDQGSRLSGGQRQRLGIARALLSHPRLLIMDEATSALDSASEAAVLQTVNELRKTICVVMVAHRLSTIRHADLIVVMREGRVVESGSWDELVAAKAVFSGLARTQQLA